MHCSETGKTVQCSAVQSRKYSAYWTSFKETLRTHMRATHVSATWMGPLPKDRAFQTGREGLVAFLFFRSGGRGTGSSPPSLRGQEAVWVGSAGLPRLEGRRDHHNASPSTLGVLYFLLVMEGQGAQPRASGVTKQVCVCSVDAGV